MYMKKNDTEIVIARKWPTLHELKERLHTKYRTDFGRACQKSCQNFLFGHIIDEMFRVVSSFFRRVDLIIARDKTLPV